MDTWKLPLKVWFWGHDATASLHPEVKKTHLFIHVKLVSAKAHLSVNTAADIMASIFFSPSRFHQEHLSGRTSIASENSSPRK